MHKGGSGRRESTHSHCIPLAQSPLHSRELVRPLPSLLLRCDANALHRCNAPVGELTSPWDDRGGGGEQMPQRESTQRISDSGGRVWVVIKEFTVGGHRVLRVSPPSGRPPL